MNEFAQQLVSIEHELAREHGPFVLFALMQREEVPDRWDLVVSAPWIIDKQAFVKDVVTRISDKFGAKELINLSRVVVADPDDASVVAFNRVFRTEHDSIDIRESVIFGLPVKHAIVISSRRPDVQTHR